jgi:hypothetical protein
MTRRGLYGWRVFGSRRGAVLVQEWNPDKSLFSCRLTFFFFFFLISITGVAIRGLSKRSPS